jgi:SAM-dependent methyltransferase
MYRPDVVSLKQFYASELGKQTALAIWRRLSALWPEATRETTLGLGYSIPYMPRVKDGLTLAAMPAEQGALYWPAGENNRVLLVNEAALPLPAGENNRVLLVHTLEHSDQLQELMQEIWRVLVPGGRMMAVAPNRMGVWSHSPYSPFGYGRPFSTSQMRELVGGCGLTPMRVDSALYLAPSHIRWLLKAAPTLEWMGRLLFPRLGGVLLVEGEKQIYAAMKEPVRSASAKPMMAPVMKPVLGQGM